MTAADPHASLTRPPESAGAPTSASQTVAVNAQAPDPGQAMPARTRNKAVAGLLGLVLGVFGLHRLYLGQRFWWLLPVLSLPLIGHFMRQIVWFRDPAFFAFAVLASIAWVQTMMICVMPSERFNARFNPQAAPATRGGGLAVVIAVVTLMVTTIVLMSALAIGLEDFFLSRGS